METSAFERVKIMGFTAGCDGHALATLPVTQDARAHIAHGARRALVARNPVTEPPMENPVTN